MNSRGNKIAGLVGAVIFACLVPAAAGQGQPAIDPLKHGQGLLEANCSRCHAIGRDGTSAHPQAPPFREVVLRYKPSDLAEALAEGIVSGHPDMPVFVFQPDEIDAIVRYLEDLEAVMRK